MPAFSAGPLPPHSIRVQHVPVASIHFLPQSAGGCNGPSGVTYLLLLRLPTEVVNCINGLRPFINDEFSSRIHFHYSVEVFHVRAL